MTTIVGPDKLCAGCNFAKARRSGHYCAECLPLVKMVQRNVKRALGTGVIPKCGQDVLIVGEAHRSGTIAITVSRACLSMFAGRVMD